MMVMILDPAGLHLQLSAAFRLSVCSLLISLPYYSTVLLPCGSRAAARAAHPEPYSSTPAASPQTDPVEFFIHPCPLGTNLYNKDRPKVVPPVRKGDLVTTPAKPDDDDQPKSVSSE